MKRVGIITINDNTNLGNRLQNYATQVLLKEQGIEAETITNYSKYVKDRHIIYWLKQKIKRLKKAIFNKKEYDRENEFLKFNKLYIKKSKDIISPKYINYNLNDKYDYFITGSDQVWNYKFGRASEVDFLTFADKEKRISFSASFGISDIPDDMKEYYKIRLENMKKISVREERGKEIINELTGREDVKVLLDPTMLINTTSWKNVMEEPKMVKKLNGKNYILNYFLGNLSDKRKKEIERIATENNCGVINILDKNDPFYTCGPSEFLYIKKNAFLICTDSFHSSVFAILFNRPFIVFDREDSNAKMNSRLDTLLKKFELEDRWFKNEIKEEQLNINYDKSIEILEKERKKAIDYINEAINQ